MKLIKAVFVAVSATLASASMAGDFLIKEYSIGMQLQDYKLQYLCKPNAEGLVACYDMAPELTIGGRKIKSILVKFDKNEGADQLYFTFPADSFDDIKAAILSKFPKVKCSKSPVQNRMGATFMNEECKSSTNNESLTLEKFSSNINSGHLMIVSSRVIDKSLDARKKTVSDI